MEGEGGGLINFPPLKRGGGLIREGGGVIENFRYVQRIALCVDTICYPVRM